MAKKQLIAQSDFSREQLSRAEYWWGTPPDMLLNKITEYESKGYVVEFRRSWFGTLLGINYNIYAVLPLPKSEGACKHIDQLVKA